MKKPFLLALIFAFTGLNAFTTHNCLPDSTQAKTIAVDEGTITFQMLDDGVVLVSWTPFDGGGNITVSARKLSDGQTSTNVVSESTTSTTFAGLQAQQTYRFRVENSGNIIITDWTIPI